ncbi:MAG: hypothetical protein EXR28_05365 [Betaproteobacteria bacterium]|nr:hypothetical protein [Betaproteobacteria bacterium]
MLTHQQNDLICRTGAGTPGGDLMRRYWQPVALVEELPSGGAPIPVELLSEKLVLFRDEKDRPTLITRRCLHRGAADRAVILMRRMMLAAVEDVRRGKDSLYVLRGFGRDPIKDMVVRSQPLPASVDVLSHWWKNA